MKIAGFLCALFGLVLFFIPVLGPILALIGLILSIVALCKNKEQKEKGLSIAGIVISAIAIILGVIFTIIIAIGVIFSVKNNIKLENSFSLNYILNEQLESQSKINYFISQGMILNENLTSKDVVKDYIIGDEEKNIAYDDSSFKLLPESIQKNFEGKVALKDSGKTYYKINEEYSLDLDIYSFVVDEEGKVYINTVLVMSDF